MLGVNLTANHKSETQVKETLDSIQNILLTFKSSPLSSTLPASEQCLDMFSVSKKLVGCHSDHAEDQKLKTKLLRRWKEENVPRAFGAQYFHSKPPEEQEALLRGWLSRMIASLGGLDAWEALSEAEKEAKLSKASIQLYEDLAEDSMKGLSESEMQKASLFVWVGCCMHKDLNAVKGGNSAMQEAWKSKNRAPVPLANRDNAAVIEFAAAGLDVETLASSRAREASIGGAAKLLSLMGALFNNKDDKKGLHDTYRWFMKANTGYLTPFPEVSNTRYASLLEAACVVFEIRFNLIDLLNFVRDLKVNRTFNNMEANVMKGLQDPCTLDELGVFVLYHEAISHPFIQTIQSPGLEGFNALDLGPFFLQVKSHIKSLIDAPSLLLSSESDPSKAILGSLDSWHHPKAVASVQEYAKTSDHIKELLLAFLSGALTTWERFMSEYNEDGLISKLNEDLKALAWTPSTNDANEGALGLYRLYARSNPRGTILYFNSKAKFLKNNTQDFIDTLLTTKSDQSHLRSRARARDSAGIDRKRQADVIEEQTQLVQAKWIKIQEQIRKKEEKNRRTLEVSLVLDPEEVRRLSNAGLQGQLARLALEDPGVPSFSQMGKSQLLQTLLSALDRYKNKNSAS